MRKLSTIFLSFILVLTLSSSMVFADEVDARITDVRVSDVNDSDSNTEKPGIMREHDPAKFKFNVKVNSEVKEGDHFDINLSENYDLTTDATYQKNIDVTDNDGEVIGKVDITANETSETTGGGVARVTFNDKVKNKVINNINLIFFGMFNKHRVKGNSDREPLYYEMYANINGHYKNHPSAVVTESKYAHNNALVLSRALNNEADKITWYANVNRRKNHQISSDVTFSVENWGGNLELIGRVLRQEVEYDERGMVTKIYRSTDITDKVEYSEDRTELTYKTDRLYAHSTRFVFETKVPKGDKPAHVLSRIRFTSGYGAAAVRSGGSDDKYFRTICTKAVASITKIVQPEPEQPTEPEKPVEPQKPDTPTQPENPNPSIIPSVPSVVPSTPSVDNNTNAVGVDNKVKVNKSVKAQKKAVKTDTPKTGDTTKLNVSVIGIIASLIILTLLIGYKRKHR